MKTELNEVERLRRELAEMEWASQKTNDGIKILYKDLEVKNEELQKLDRLRSKFVSTVSHELRTPLTVILQTAENLMAGAFGPLNDAQRIWVERVSDNANHLCALIGEVLDLSKLESAGEDAVRDDVELNSLLKRTVDNLRPLADKKRIALSFTEKNARLKVWASARQLVQVLTNLAGNALKYTPAGGRVDVACESDEREAFVSVRDTGPGIPAKDLQIIFDPFVQSGERPEDSSQGGIGLGLTICREIMARHKGRIWAESEPGKGSRFIFALPLDKEAP